MQVVCNRLILLLFLSDCHVRLAALRSVNTGVKKRGHMTPFPFSIDAPHSLACDLGHDFFRKILCLLLDAFPQLNTLETNYGCIG